ncbi:hypothetical protein HPB50_000219 [Hyalomma asiaticum]|uniref:Uncharacterized protein n=1 Tax=Hyalomma asiaticum TaxID=266040 RepID=A0ACB7RX22_HYAAI|nr:hypothetical protein HPB50_000219 [Hyalomma asiaticum]
MAAGRGITILQILLATLFSDYQRGINCTNSHGHQLHKCVGSFRETLERAVLKRPAKEVIDYTCCAYYDLLDCVSKTLTPCESVGSKALMLGFLEQVFGETLNLVCDQHTKGSKACQVLPQLPELRPKDRRIENVIELVLETSSTLGHKN